MQNCKQHIFKQINQIIVKIDKNTTLHSANGVSHKCQQHQSVEVFEEFGGNVYIHFTTSISETANFFNYCLLSTSPANENCYCFATTKLQTT